MHIPRFFLTPADIGSGLTGGGGPLDLEAGRSIDITSKVVANQIINVLRMRAGDGLIVLNGLGGLYRCSIERMERHRVVCRIDTAEQAAGDAPVSVTVAIALIKGERFEWCLQKLTELGVSAVVPLVTARTIVKISPGTAGDAKGTSSRLARWQAIVREAAEQSERATIPQIVPPKKLEDFIRSCTGGGTPSYAFICAERLSTMSLRHIFSDHPCNRSASSGTADKTISLIIGPEGGFTKDELDFAQEQGIKPVSLGPRILRSETAAIYALAQIMWCLEK